MEDRITLYQNVYYDHKDRLVFYQQYHKSVDDAKKTFVRQSNGDRPAFIIEVIGKIVHP